MAKKGPVDGGPGPPGKATETLLKQGLRPGLAEAEDRPGCGVPVHSSLSHSLPRPPDWCSTDPFS